MPLDPNEKERRGLPVREFLYTLDQVAYILNVEMSNLRQYVVFDDVGGRRQPSPRRAEGLTRGDDRMRAVRIEPTEIHAQPEWRVPEGEFIRYLKGRNLVVYERRLR